MDDLRAELWHLALLVAMSRLGILPMLRNEEGRWVAPSADVAADREGTRKARRKYRKLWRRELARDTRWFDRLPKRQKKRHRWTVAMVKGRRHSEEDPLAGRLLTILSFDVGQAPSRCARGHRWNLVKRCPELRAVLLQVAKEFGLLDPQRNM